MRAAGLIVLMVLGSLLMWVGLPVALLWVASATVKSAQPTMGGYALVMIGLPVGLLLIYRWLGALDRAYARHTAAAPQRRQAPWLRSMRGERTEQRSWAVLDVVMLTSVAVAGAAVGLWFVLFGDGSASLPG